MGAFFLLLFIFFFVIPLLRVGVAVYKVRRRMRDMVNGAYGARANGAPADKPRKAGWSAPRQHRKKIGADVGEYVKYEELTVMSSETADGGSSTRVEHFTAESQVVDADWEDIK